MDDTSPLREDRVSSQVSAHDAPAFFEKYGIFYESNAAVGKRVDELQFQAVPKAEQLVPFFSEDKVSIPLTNLGEDIKLIEQRLHNVLQKYRVDPSSICFVLGESPGNFYAWSTSQNQGVIVWSWGSNTEVEFSIGSHRKPDMDEASIPASISAPASNGLEHIPYKYLSKSRHLKDQSIKMTEGGV